MSTQAKTKTAKKAVKKTKKIKKIKVESPAKIHRRLFKKWSLLVRQRANNTCEICGSRAGEVDARSSDGSVTKIDAHHIEGRKFTTVLRFDSDNGIALCSRCHKFDKNSAHNSTIWFYEQLREKLPKRLDYVRAVRESDNDGKHGSAADYRDWLYNQEALIDAEAYIYTRIEELSSEECSTALALFNLINQEAPGEENVEAREKLDNIMPIEKVSALFKTAKLPINHV